ncbi:PIG-L deacetylase family protein [Paenibacillus contaminans]|uniref:PIG-L family deacetylase n=1 Tax=Paenibacillus contaminans TaxID=450362 RepID=A0A329MQA9_9BACL|nr:PIG-L family deacetylase [Paenibacillus contaminans]RAV22119.1 PIG-L family deacetylase [Paenibacillus contaminans]
MNYRKILVLAPHTDDAELGCGGTIARMLEEGSEVYVAAFSTAVESLPAGMAPDTLENEFRDAMAVIGVKPEHVFVYYYPVRKFSYQRQEILEELVKLRRDIKPDLVLLPSSQDVHQDHQVIHAEGVRAFKEVSVFGYELPWNQPHSSASAVIRLERRHLERKWLALQMYRSQLALERTYFSKEFITGLASVRGIQIKTELAEAYEVVRVSL